MYTYVILFSVVLVCITAYLIMTKDSRLKERELKLKEEELAREHTLKMKALKHEQKLQNDAIERAEGCKHTFKVYQELVTKNSSGSVTGFTNVYKCEQCGKFKEESIDV